MTLPLFFIFTTLSFVHVMSFPQIFTDILASHFSMARAAKRSYFTLRNFLVALPDCDRRSPIALMSGSRRPDRTDRPTRPTDRSQTKTFVFCMFSFPVSKHRRCVHVYFVLGTTGRNMCLSQPNERREKGARGKRVLANPLHNLHQQVAKTRVRSVRIELTTLGL